MKTEECKREPFDLRRALFEGIPVCTRTGIQVTLQRFSIEWSGLEGFMGGDSTWRCQWTTEGIALKPLDNLSDLRLGVPSAGFCHKCKRQTPSWEAPDDLNEKIGPREALCPVCVALAYEATVDMPLMWEWRLKVTV